MQAWIILPFLSLKNRSLYIKQFSPFIACEIPAWLFCSDRAVSPLCFAYILCYVNLYGITYDYDFFFIEYDFRIIPSFSDNVHNTKCKGLFLRKMFSFFFSKLTNIFKDSLWLHYKE